MNNTRPTHIGIDIGRVLLGAPDEDGRADTSFLSGSVERALAMPPTPGAFHAVSHLVGATGGRVWLVSKCGPRIESLTRRWLEHWRFFDLTGLQAGHVRFCRERPEKRRHAEELGLSHFVDDRLDVLEPMRGVVGGLILFGHQPRGTLAPEWVTPALDWPSALRALGFVEEAEVLRRNLATEPDAVGREAEDVSVARHPR